MVIKQQWKVTCRGCKKEFTVYEYVGLEGGRYGSHHCEQIADYWIKHPRATRAYDPKV
jgi:hypothetical protein